METIITNFIGEKITDQPTDPAFTTDRLGVSVDAATGTIYKIGIDQWVAMLNSIAVASMGAATPSTTPATPTKGQFYIATQTGTYTNFLDNTSTAIVVSSGDGVVILSYDGTAWVKQTTDLGLTGYVKDSDIVNLSGKNLFDKSKIRVGYVNSSGGYDSSDSNYSTSPLIPVTAGTTYTISGLQNPTSPIYKYYGFLDAGSNIISYGAMSATSTLTAPANAVSLQFTCSYVSVDSVDALQVEVGSTATSYAPYSAYVASIAGNSLQIIDTTAFAPLATTYSKTDVNALLPTIASSIVPANKNLFDKTKSTDGYLINNDGTTSASTLYGYTDYIPVVAGQSYTGWDTLHGMRRVCYYDSAKNVVAGGSYNDVTTFTIPVGVAFVRVTFYLQFKNYFQFEQGSSATSYVPFFQTQGQISSINGAPLFGGTPLSNGLFEIAIAPAYGSIRMKYNYKGHLFEHYLNAIRQPTIDVSECFDWSSFYLDGVLQHGQGEDAAPYRLFGSGITVGGNHGYDGYTVTMAAHGKGNVDVGSVWSDGTNQWVLINIRDANNLDISSKTTSTLTGTTLGHISGATNTGTITIASSVALAWHPTFINHAVSIFIDDKQIDATTAQTLYGAEKLIVKENYDVCAKNDLLTWIMTQTGTATQIVKWGGTATITVSMSYTFYPNGQCTISTDFLALQAVASFSDIMFVMANSTANNPSYYIPKSLPFSQNSISYDFRTNTQKPGSPATRLDFDTTKTLSTGMLVDRLLMLNGTVGFAIGYLPVKDADPSVRRTNASNKALEISEINKVYMACIDGLKTSLAAGDYFNSICYKTYFLPNANRTDSYVVRSNDADYFYADWHSSNVADRIEVPNELAGRTYTVVEKSSNVSVLTEPTGTIVLAANITSDIYGYAILKFQK